MIQIYQFEDGETLLIPAGSTDPKLHYRLLFVDDKPFVELKNCKITILKKP